MTTELPTLGRRFQIFMQIFGLRDEDVENWNGFRQIVGSGSPSSIRNYKQGKMPPQKIKLFAKLLGIDEQMLTSEQHSSDEEFAETIQKHYQPNQETSRQRMESINGNWSGRVKQLKPPVYTSGNYELTANFRVTGQQIGGTITVKGIASDSNFHYETTFQVIGGFLDENFFHLQCINTNISKKNYAIILMKINVNNDYLDGAFTGIGLLSEQFTFAFIKMKRGNHLPAPIMLEELIKACRFLPSDISTIKT